MALHGLFQVIKWGAHPFRRLTLAFLSRGVDRIPACRFGDRFHAAAGDTM